MKESILDVLLYLFEHYFTEDADLIRDRDSLQNGLLQAGFSTAETSKAFDWLDAPVINCAGKDVPMPYAANLEKLALITAADVVEAVRKVTYR